MKNIEKIKLWIVLLVSLLFASGKVSADKDWVEVHVDKETRLADAFDGMGVQPSSITSLKVIGEMKAVDMDLLRTLCKGNLSAVDLYDADYTDSVRFHFQQCVGLESVKLMSNMAFVPSGTFKGCHLSYIFIPKSVRRICRDAFEDCI